MSENKLPEGEYIFPLPDGAILFGDEACKLAADAARADERARVLAEVKEAVETAYYAPIEEHPTATRILRCINRVLALFDVGGRFWPEAK